jgi:hypothetical protein
MEEFRNAYKISWETLREEGSWETKCRCEDILKG